MKIRIPLFIITGLLLSGCLLPDTKCCDFIGAYPISKGLYLEKYRTFCAGVYGEVTTCYLTDSMSFRQKIGSYDEHDKFYAEKVNDKIVTYNFRWSRDPDTLEIKTFSKTELSNYHHGGKNILATAPLFGQNTIKCDSNFCSLSSWQTDEGPYWSELQYKCGVDDFEDAVFYTDSSTYCVFIGVCAPGNSDHYSAKVNKNGTFDFYYIDWKERRDTVKSETFLLTDLKKQKFLKVCE
jgi:hypothetical protein